MLMLSFIALGVLMAAAALVTVLALGRAKDGYEDDSGFHAGSPPPPASVAQKAPRPPEWMRQLHAVVNRTAPPPRGTRPTWEAEPVAAKEKAETAPPRELVER